MWTFEECLALKKKFRKEYPDNTVIFKLDTYPDVVLIVNHENNKSWGYFFGEQKTYFIGVCDKWMAYAYTKYKEYSILNKQFVCIYDKEFVRNAYYKYYQSLPDKIYGCIMEMYERQAVYFNPELFARCIDADIRIDRVSSSSISCSESSIKAAFGMSLPYVKLLTDNWNYYLNLVKQAYKENISIQDIQNNKLFYCWNFPEEYVTRQVVEYCKHVDNIYTYSDYLIFIKDMPVTERKQFPITPKDLYKWHDRAYKLHRHIIEEERLKTQKEKNERYIEKYYPEASKFAFKDDEFSIFPCSDLNQLVEEGSALHHCVGTYFNSVSLGKEYILFLRRNNDINKPFFTVDLTPDLRVRQIHGLRNCNITKEIRPFVEKWAKKFNLDTTHTSGVLGALG